MESHPEVTLSELLLRDGSKCELEAGTVLWREGDLGDEVVFLEHGTLDVVLVCADGHEVVLQHLEAGAILGEIACLDGRRRSAGVRAATTCRISRYPAQAFRELLRRRPDLLQSLLLQQVDLVRKLTGQVTQTHQRAITDGLTRLYNVGFFFERLSLELERARATHDPVSLVMLDIDHFKGLNDSHGHETGNEILVQVARILKDASRRGDIVARYGGEEFVALLYGADRRDAARFAQTLREGIEATPFRAAVSPQHIRLTVSAGVATAPEDAGDSRALMGAADARLYRAKQAGRNCVVWD